MDRSKRRKKRWYANKPHVKQKWCCGDGQRLCPNPQHWNWTVGNDMSLFPPLGFGHSYTGRVMQNRPDWIEAVLEKAVMERHPLALQALGWYAFCNRPDAKAVEYQQTVKNLYADIFEGGMVKDQVS